MDKLERLDKILSKMGYGSRKEVKKLIREGIVRINDELIVKYDYKVNPRKDNISVRGERLDYREFIYLMMNKPPGLVSSTEDPHSATVIGLLEEKYLKFNPFPAGRLDKDTEGLLLITNDGQLAHQLLSPKKNVFKKYYVEVDGYLEDKDREIFLQGIVLDDGYKTLPASLDIIESALISKVHLEIQEGKYHQVKRMFESLFMRVLYLKRLAIGPLLLDDKLSLGEYRELVEEEVRALQNI